MAKNILKDAKQNAIALKFINYLTSKTYRNIHKIAHEVAVNHGQVRLLTKEYWGEIINFLEHASFIEYHIDDNDLIKLTDEGQKLKELGDFNSYYYLANKSKAKDAKRESLNDILLENHVALTNEQKSWRKNLPIIAIIVSVLSVIATITLPFVVRKDKPIQVVVSIDKRLKLEIDSYLDSLFSDSSYRKSITSLDTGVRK